MVGRRDQVAASLERTRILTLLEALPKRPQLLVLNFHRIGDNSATDFDPEVFTTSTDLFDDLVARLNASYAIVHPNEALEIIEGKARLNSTVVLLTFDDGYRDNLTEALPVLQAHRASAVYFLVTGYLDAPETIPGWDRIAWLVRRSVGQSLFEHHDDLPTIEIRDRSLTADIAGVMSLFRRSSVSPARIFDELERVSGYDRNAMEGTERLLMDWDEARAVQDAGIVIGAHTHNHPILARLAPEQQAVEFARCTERMERHLGTTPELLAYPVGSETAFNEDTQRLARAAGFRAAFSFYGGTNRPGAMSPFDVRRTAIPSYAPPPRIRTSVGLMAQTGRIWF